MSDIRDKIYEMSTNSEYLVKSFKFSQDIPKHPNPLKLSKWYAQEIIEITNQIDIIEKEFDLTCVCTKGCSACCKQLIVIKRPEMLAMKPVFENLEKWELSLLKEKVLYQCKVLEENNIKFINSKLASNEHLRNKYFELGMECPLLTSIHECMVHDVRPAACWSYCNYGNKEDCNYSSSVPQSFRYDYWYEIVTNRIKQTIGKKQRESGVLQYFLKECLHTIRF